MVRYGVLSTASIVPRFVGAAQEAANAEVVALASRSLNSARAKADVLGIARAYGSYEELLADPDVDAVYIPLVNSLHHPWALRALEAGRTESPITTAERTVAHLELVEELYRRWGFEA